MENASNVHHIKEAKCTISYPTTFVEEMNAQIVNLIPRNTSTMIKVNAKNVLEIQSQVNQIAMVSEESVKAFVHPIVWHIFQMESAKSAHLIKNQMPRKPDANGELIVQLVNTMTNVVSA